MSTQLLIADAFNVPSLAGTGDLVRGEFALPEGQTAKGMGQLFASDNPTSWGIGEWAVVALGGYVAISLFFDARTAGHYVGRKSRRTVKKAASGATNMIGKVALVGGVAALGYFGYQYFTNQAATASTGATQ